MDTTRHLDFDELMAGVGGVLEAPADDGTVEAIVVRPRTNERLQVEDCVVSPEGGVEGDTWAQGCWLELDDGSPHPDVQVTIMNCRVTNLIAQDRTRWALTGDQIFADLDVSHENLPIGQRISIGSAVMEITNQPHLGCKKFAHRFGNDALRFVNRPEGRGLRLRGVYARIVEAGKIAVGDTIRKI